MALRGNIEKIAYDQISSMVNKASRYTGAVARTLDTDFANLLEKATEFKISQLGTPVMDYVTIYTDDLGVGVTSGAYTKKGVSIINNRADALKAKSDYVIKDHEREWKRIEQVFKKQQNATFYNVTLMDVSITVNRPRNIVTNQVFGSDFTVKEYISNGDYVINLEGTLAGTNPYQTDTIRMQQLDAMFRYGRSLKVSSIYLNNIFDVIDVAVMDYSFTQRRDYGNLTDFSISMLSDPKDFEFVKPAGLTDY